MPHARFLAALLASTAALAVAMPAVAEPFFDRTASFPVARNLPAGADPATPTSAEIVAAGGDGMTLVYSDSPNKAIGFIDITDPAAPAALGEGGFWLASEGDPDAVIPHALIRVDADGEITEEIGYPLALLGQQTRSGSEGVTVADGKVWIAIQREWGDDPKGEAKLLAWDPEAEEWSAVRYPLEAAETGWVGLSEITAHDGFLYLIERDNQIGENARVKQLTRVPLAGLAPAPLGGELPLVSKEVVRDLIPDLAAPRGYVVDKVEGFTIDAGGSAYVVTDNDGVDDSSGETHFLPLEAM
jgi:hypothetical protein